MLSGFTSKKSANLYMYLIKAIYKWLLVAVKKKLNILVKAAEKWMLMSGFLSSFLSAILLLLSLCSLDMSLYTAVCKGFVMRDWYAEAVLVFEGKVKATQILIEYIRTKHRVEIKKTGLVGDNGVVSGLSSSIVSTLSAGVVHMLGVIKSFTIRCVVLSCLARMASHM
ncbi:hypothetical protein G9A89_016805 [Geosiphon pyriformis]|nr:hypothetical protein G9A89_016805 [Geosiphon pyriformis]